MAGTVLTLALLGVPAVFAGSTLPSGAAAPAFEAKEFINTEPVSMMDLRGRVIFYEIFRTW